MVKSGKNSQTGGRGSPTWEKFPHFPVFFLATSLICFVDLYHVELFIIYKYSASNDLYFATAGSAHGIALDIICYWTAPCWHRAAYSGSLRRKVLVRYRGVGRDRTTKWPPGRNYHSSVITKFSLKVLRNLVNLGWMIYWPGYNIQYPAWSSSNLGWVGKVW